MGDNKLMSALAMIIAEHEVMKAKLAEMGEIHDEVPAKWCSTGEPLVNLDEVIHDFNKSALYKEFLNSVGLRGWGKPK